MKPFDPEFAELSNEQLAEVDSFCSRYESSRMRGEDISLEALVQTSSKELKSLLQVELIQIEMEILEAWDQLDSLNALLNRFPDHEALIREKWGTLKSQGVPCNPLLSHQETKGNAVPGSTHGDGHIGQADNSSLESEVESAVLEDPSPRFHITRHLAQGGIGTVFVAFDRDLQREVAIKELKRKFATDPSVVKRFQAEATVTGNLEHPNIVPIYATGRRSDGRPFYAMRLIQGKSMLAAISEIHSQGDQNLDFRRNPVARNLLLRFVTVCRAIGFAHSRGVLHRDLKPSNIMVGEFGETLVVDWGLARKTGSSPIDQQTKNSLAVNLPNAEETLHGTVVGTPGYMSPEQESGLIDEISNASDIFSLGATLSHILTNQPPTKQLPDASESSKRMFANVPPPLEAICRKAMEAVPRARYASAELLGADVEAWLIDEPVSVLPETRLQKLRRWARAHQAIVTSGIASLVITMIAMAVTLSILANKNESLRKSNQREQASALESSQNAEIAKANGEEAVRQRQRVLGILKTFLFDVERGLADVPGGAAVQFNLLTTVLQKIGDVSNDFAGEDQLSLSNAMALIDLGDLFSRVGTKDIKLDLPKLKQANLSPLEAASEMYAEAMKIAIGLPQQDLASRRLIAGIQQKQAEIYRLTARTSDAKKLIEESIAARRALLAESPDSVEAAIEVVASIDILGQIYLQDVDIPKAKEAFGETEIILETLSQDFPNDLEVKRLLGITCSRLADIAVKQGDLDSADKLYDRDLAIATELYLNRPEDRTSKRDLCVSLDRIGNMSAQRGQLEKAMEAYLESRRLREELHAAEPTNLKTSLELLVSYFKSGDTRMLLDDVPNARADYEKALALSDELARFDPQNAKARRFQSISAEVLADIAIKQEKLDDALAFAKRSLDISLELIAKDPTDGQKLDDLNICYLKVAKVHLKRRDFEACFEQLELALQIVKPAHEKQPDSRQAIMHYSGVELRFAEAYSESGDLQAAIPHCQLSITLQESIPEALRQDANSRRRLANSLTMLGRAQLGIGQKEDASSSLKQARQLIMTMIDDKMRVEQMQLDLKDVEDLINSLNDTSAAD